MRTWGEGKHLTDVDIAVPSNMIAIGDTASDFVQDWAINPAWDYALATLRPGFEQLSRRHESGSNMLLCDTHVEYGQQTNWVAETTAARRRWYKDNQSHTNLWRWR